MRSKILLKSKEVIPAVEEAIKQNDPFDIVVLDIQMPGISGYEVARKIKNHKDSQVAGTPLLAFSSSATRRTRIYQEAGFNGFLPKPIQRNKLITMIKRLLGAPPEKEPDKGKETVITQHTLAEEAKHSIHILLVEDNLLNQKLAVYMLTKAGYQIDIANNGKEAIEKYTTDPQKFDLIFMDVNMPELDGMEATRVIRNRGYKDIPIIAITADALKEDRERCLESGMNDYIAKPIKREVVFSMVKKWVFSKK
jgi:CheY-like chemotaxis protein